MEKQNEPEVKIEEIGGDRYNDVREASAALVTPLARAVAEVIRQGLENGIFEVVDGQVMVK